MNNYDKMKLVSNNNDSASYYNDSKNKFTINDPVKNVIKKYKPDEDKLTGKQEKQSINYSQNSDYIENIRFDNVDKNISTIQHKKESETFGEGLTLLTPALNEAKEKENEEVEQHLYEVQNVLNKSHTEYYTDPITGDQIANATKEKIWVANNILFIISTGAIFDENDKAFADSIMNYFNIHESEYLGCSIKMYPYKSDIIRTLERAAALQNGNYHLCIFVINYSSPENIKYAPEELFTKRGLCEALYEEVAIRDEMMRLMKAYGYSKFIRRQYSKAHKMTERDLENAVDVNVQYNTEIDFNSPTNRELFGNLKTEDTITGTRTRIKGSVDGLRSHPRMYKNRNQSDRTNAEIVKRINDDDYITFNYPMNTQGGNKKIKDYTDNRTLNKDRIPGFKLKETETDILAGNNDRENILINTSLNNTTSFKMFDEKSDVMQVPNGYNSMFSNVSHGEGTKGRKQRK